jgi:hypothetical protein
MDYVSNSKKSKEPEEEPKEKVTVTKRVEKVVTGPVVEKKPTVGKKMRGIFFGPGVKSTGEYIYYEILIPALRDLVVDTVSRGVNRAVYGESTYGPRRRGNERSSRITYDRVPMRDRVYETTGRERERAHIPDQPMRPKNRRGGLEFVLQTRAEAEGVVEQLSAALEKYDVVSVADLRDALGHKIQYTDNAWGWTVLNDVEIRQVRDGWLLDLPPAEALR